MIVGIARFDQKLTPGERIPCHEVIVPVIPEERSDEGS